MRGPGSDSGTDGDDGDDGPDGDRTVEERVAQERRRKRERARKRAREDADHVPEGESRPTTEELTEGLERSDASGPGRPGGPGTDDPRTVRSVAVTGNDVVTAVEANARDRATGRAVLRVTPPFTPRMRARIHVTNGREDYDDPAPIHVDPSALVDGTPAYPTPDETEDALRSDPETTYTPDRHRERHVAAVEHWREEVRSSVADEVELPLSDENDGDGGAHRVEVSLLGPQA
jgi:hypothetical protein